ncbi:MAG: hypothetical protein AB1589_37800 [Cyanobacteriota bacterium]
MNRVITSLLNLRLRQLFTVFLIGLTFWVMQAFGYSNQLQAQATPLTPEASAYQVDNTDTFDTGAIRNDKQVENAQQNLKDTADNVREKLNLDQPIYPGTKEVLNDVQDSVKDAVNAVTGNNESDNR